MSNKHALTHSQVTRTPLTPLSTPIRHANYLPERFTHRYYRPYTTTVHPCPAHANPHPHAELYMYRVDYFPGGESHVEPRANTILFQWQVELDHTMAAPTQGA